MDGLIQIVKVVGNNQAVVRLIGLHKSGVVWNGEIITGPSGKYKITWTTMDETIKTAK